MATAPLRSDFGQIWRNLWQHPLIVAPLAAGLFVLVWLGFAMAMLRWQTGLPPLADMLLREMIPVLACVAIYKLVIARLGRFRKDDLALHGMLVDGMIGLGVGAALVSAVAGVAILTGVYGIAELGAARDAVQIIVIAGISAAVIEEVLLRGILFRWLEEAGGSMAALVLTSALVGATYGFYPGATPVAVAAQMAVFGLLMGGAYMLTRSLWLAIGLHAAWNVTLALGWGEPVSGIQYEGLVVSEFGGPDWLSGGMLGLGSSAIALGVAALFGLWLLRAARRQGHWLTFGWQRALTL